MMPDVMSFLKERQTVVERLLDEYLPKEERFPSLIHKAMRYSVFSGGKRLRPILVLECCSVCGGDERNAYPAAAAVEYIHTYSLIHDDLPCMDDDDIRRGKPTSHRVFGEAIAVLAGDGLLTAAFGTLSHINDTELMKKVLSEIAEAVGSTGMVGGQTLDITPPDKEPYREYVYSIHKLKTASLIRASCRIGAFFAYPSAEKMAAISTYGRNIGLAFQITDDILDETATQQQLGKKTQKDRGRGRITYPLVFGLEESKREAKRLVSEALEALRIFDERGENLSALAEFIVNRIA